MWAGLDKETIERWQMVIASEYRFSDTTWMEKYIYVEADNKEDDLQLSVWAGTAEDAYNKIASKNSWDKLIVEEIIKYFIARLLRD
jgi:hypothetical protein